MTDSALPPLVIEKSANDVKKSKKKKKAAAKAQTAEIEDEEEEAVELVEEVEEEKPAAKTKKTGAQKRKEKKEREQVEAKTQAKAEKKAEKKPKVVNVVQASVVRVVKAAVIEDEWVTAEPIKKGKAVAQKAAEPTQEEAEAQAEISQKQKKKAAKDRAEQQRKNAKKNDHLSNLPEEVLAQMAKFNPEAAPTESLNEKNVRVENYPDFTVFNPVLNFLATAAVITDDWTDIAVKPAYVPKSKIVEAVVDDAEAREAAPVFRRPDKVVFYKDATQAEIFTTKGDRAGNEELSKYSFKGLEASW